MTPRVGCERCPSKGWQGMLACHVTAGGGASDGSTLRLPWEGRDPRRMTDKRPANVNARDPACHGHGPQHARGKTWRRTPTVRRPSLPSVGGSCAPIEHMAGVKGNRATCTSVGRRDSELGIPIHEKTSSRVGASDGNPSSMSRDAHASVHPQIVPRGAACLPDRAFSSSVYAFLSRTMRIEGILSCSIAHHVFLSCASLQAHPRPSLLAHRHRPLDPDLDRSVPPSPSSFFARVNLTGDPSIDGSWNLRSS